MTQHKTQLMNYNWMIELVTKEPLVNIIGIL